MKTEMIFSGFGGQGALTIGKFIAQAAMEEGKNVSWLPSYGPEMRGGTACVFTIVSDKPVASPLVDHANILVALNQPSLDKFDGNVVKGGLIIVNKDMCPNIKKKTGIDYVIAPLNTIAQEIGSMKILNMLAIGVIIGKTGLIKYKTIEAALKAYMGKKDPALLEMNLKAIKKGIELGK